MGKITREKFKTYGNVFDNFTLRNLFNLSNKGFFTSELYPLKTGKESNVFLAENEKEERIVIKIYRLENCNFNKMFDYLRQDERFQSLKGKKRKIIFEWTKREFKNLLRAREAGIYCPTPYAFLHNIILMEFIGSSDAAPQLKDKIPNRPETFINKIVDGMKKMHIAGLVHGDLSEFNILNYKEKPAFIDFSQGTLIRSENYEELLRRDCKNIARFSKKIGVENDEESIFEKIISKKRSTS